MIIFALFQAVFLLLKLDFLYQKDSLSFKTEAFSHILLRTFI